jgi:hypothetical protein
MFVVLNKMVDMQVGYHHLEMDNYIDNSPITVPYGQDIEQEHIFTDFHFRISGNISGRIGLHYYEQTDMASAGYRDYEVYVLNSSLQYIF